MSDNNSGLTWRAQNRAHYAQQRAKKRKKPDFEEKRRDRAQLEDATRKFLDGGGIVRRLDPAHVLMGTIEGVELDYMTGGR